MGFLIIFCAFYINKDRTHIFTLIVMAKLCVWSIQSQPFKQDTAICGAISSLFQKIYVLALEYLHVYKYIFNVVLYNPPF